MTTPFIAIASLLASAAGNNIQIGDQANFKGTIQQGSMNAGFTLSLKVASFDPASGKYTVETAQVMESGDAQTAVADRTANEIGDEATASAIVESCEDYGGSRETVAVASEQLNTCKVAQGDASATQEINIGAVQFMIVKYVDTQSDGMITKLNLTSYVRGH
jgi:hypothetical protein